MEKQRIVGILLPCLLLGVVTTTTPAQEKDAPATGRYYQIKDVRSGLVLAIVKEDDAKIIQAKAAADTTQQWQFVKVGGYYKIVNRKSGKVVDVRKGDKKVGTQIIQFKDHGGQNQQWSLEKQGKSFVLKSRHSGLVIEANGNNLFDLVPVK
jgi:hypothetical protein